MDRWLCKDCGALKTVATEEYKRLTPKDEKRLIAIVSNNIVAAKKKLNEFKKDLKGYITSDNNIQFETEKEIYKLVQMDELANINAFRIYIDALTMASVEDIFNQLLLSVKDIRDIYFFQ